MTDKKKEIEAWFLNEARLASTLFPRGTAIAREHPDFLIGALGIEVTELCREAERGEGARLGNVASKAQALYAKRSDAKPINVTPLFSRDAHDMNVDVLATTLSDFVAAHADKHETFGWRQTPAGYSQIGVSPVVTPNDQAPWRYFRAFDTVLATKALLDGRIADKNGRVSAYRDVAPAVWLLIVDNLSLGPGEVHVRAEDLAEWTFDFAFDKVLVFVRQPGGTGQVIELRRPF